MSASRLPVAATSWRAAATISCHSSISNRVASFSMSRAQWSSKEDKLHEEVDNRTREIESAKQDLLSKTKMGKGQWKEELATQSESVVKAERSEIEMNEETIRKLQEVSKRATVVKKK